MNDQKLQNIRQAENTAKEILNSVEEETQAMVRQAYTDVVHVMEHAKEEARNHEKQLLNEFQKKGQEQAEKILSGLDSEFSKIKSHSQSQEQKAIAFLHEQMKVNYGNR